MRQVKPIDFFAGHSVFRREDFGRALANGRTLSSRTIDSHLDRYLRVGRIGRVKRGVFFAAGPGETAMTSPVDFLLAASRLAPDAVLGYHTALETHGYAHSAYERVFFLTQHKAKAVRFRGRVFVPVAQPRVLQRRSLADAFITEIERRGLPCRVTSLERTVVDALDRPDLSGGVEEVWRSLAAIPLLDLRAVVDYVRLREVATLAAKVGLFLERHKDHFSVRPSTLEELQALRPRAPHYVDRSVPGSLVATWNLIVPQALGGGELASV
jgi:predicted transcriptional regulator of viral defense system